MRILEAAADHWRGLDDRADGRDELARPRMRDVASTAGVALATLYDHFPSQGVLATSVMRNHLSPMFDRARVFGATDGPADDGLVELVGMLARGLSEHRALVGTMMQAIDTYTYRFGAPRGAAEDPRTALPLPRVFTTVIQRGQAEGTFDDSLDAMEVASAILNLTILRAHTRPTVTPDSGVDFIIHLILRGLLTRSV